MHGDNFMSKMPHRRTEKKSKQKEPKITTSDDYLDGPAVKTHVPSIGRELTFYFEVEDTQIWWSGYILQVV